MCKFKKHRNFTDFFTELYCFLRGGESLTTNIYIEFVDISQSSSSFSYRFGLFTIFEIFALFLFFIQFIFCFWTPTIQFSFQFFLHYWLYIMRVCHSVYWFPNNYHSIVCSFYLLLFLLLHFCLNRNTKSLEFTSAYTLSTHSFSQHHTRGVQMYTGISRELKNTHKHKHSYTHTYAALCKSERGLESFCCIHTYTNNTIDISVFAERNAQIYMNETKQTPKRVIRTRMYITAVVRARWVENVVMLNVGACCI